MRLQPRPHASGSGSGVASRQYTYLCGCGIGKIPALLKEAGVEDIISDCLADEGREDLGRIRIVQLDVIGSSEQDVERCGFVSCGGKRR
jgi:hypothetical protein